MAFSISWIAVKERDRDDVLAELGLEDTGEPDPEARAKFSWATLPGGWLLIHANSFGWAAPEQVAKASAGGLAVGCAVEEHVMCSRAYAYKDGCEVWAVQHDPAKPDGVFDLAASGELPDAFAAIKDRLFQKQKDDGGEQAGVDHVFDAPFELAAAVTGFRHDEDLPGPEDQTFIELRSFRPGLFSLLFGRR